MNTPVRLFWGDTHHNTYQHCRQDPPLDKVLDFARTHLDFYTGAYYTAIFSEYGLRDGVAETVSPTEAGGHAYEASEGGPDDWRGIRVEACKPAADLRREWEEFQRIVRAQNTPGDFVVFPGYEWQGNAHWGDHNVMLPREGIPVCTVQTLPELYAHLREVGGLAIPHHTGYLPGMRAPRWEACDDSLSPFAELFSVHGCSETDEERPGLRRNPHMGPGVAGGTYREALLRGLRLGAICSTDNWTNMPGHWGHGLMGCWAEDLTREALWDAFMARRVYGVTGDRIRLRFQCNGAPMGSVLKACPRRSLRVEVEGVDALDRIEILRNEQVIHTHSHQDTWRLPPEGSPTRFKLRVEVGWGPLRGEIPLPAVAWEGRLSLSAGHFLGWSPCWTRRGQSVPSLRDAECRLEMRTEQGKASDATQQAVVLEFDADPGARLDLAFNGNGTRDSVRRFSEASRLLWYRDRTAALVRELTGFDGSGDERGDMLYHLSPKVKIHRAIPAAGYSQVVEIEDDAPLKEGGFYRIRVEQRNGQRAWSSPIWILPF